MGNIDNGGRGGGSVAGGESGNRGEDHYYK